MTDHIGSYRIRWANVLVLNRSDQRVRMCMAERRQSFLGLKFWWPIGEWRNSEAACESDIAYDRSLRAPMPKCRYL